MRKADGVFKVLSLDGGGGKGTYTLGILKEVEQLVGKPLNEEFSLFYGTSTGSIIASALACGASVDEITQFYLKNLPDIMARFASKRRSSALKAALRDYFKERKFSDLGVGLGVVATNRDDKKAMIFKSLPNQAHGMKATFAPGFGLTIAEAVEASCSAYPFFQPKKVFPVNSPPVTAVDGGFVANNPSLYALIDIREALKIPDPQVRMLSLGTGTYPESFPVYAFPQGALLIPTLKLISMQFSASANSTETVFNLLSKGIQTVRVNDTFAEPELATSLFEHRQPVLERLLSKGRQSFGRHEASIRSLLL